MEDKQEAKTDKPSGRKVKAKNVLNGTFNIVGFISIKSGETVELTAEQVKNRRIAHALETGALVKV